MAKSARMPVESTAMLNVFLVTCFSVLITSVTSQAGPAPCSHQSLRTAMGCTASLGFLGRPTQFVDQTLSDRLVQGCGYGTFLDAVDCLDKVMTECRHDNSSATNFLRSTVDVAKTRRTIVYFCENVNKYLSNAQCVQSHLPEVATCSSQAQKTFMSTAQTTKDQGLLATLQCRFISKATSCMYDVMSTRCNPEVASIISNTMNGFVPPSCSGSVSYGVIGESAGSDGGGGGDGNSATSCRFQRGGLFPFVGALSLWMLASHLLLLRR